MKNLSLQFTKKNKIMKLTEEQKKKYSSAIKQGFVTDEPGFWHTFCGTWVRKHPGRTSLLVRLRDILGRNPEWSDMTDDTISDLKDDMKEQLAPNSVRTICAELRAVLNRNKATKPIPAETFPLILRSKRVPSQAVYLTPVELKTLHLYQPRTPRERYVKEMFMRECLTGARSVDCRCFTSANIHEEDGTKYLTYVPRKHPIVVTVPVHKWLMQYMHEDWPEEYLMSRQDHNNEILQRVCRKAGITARSRVYVAGKTETGPKWHFIASHTGRRTFATLLSLKGCPLEQIALMMGHVNGNTPNVMMTAAYICERSKISKSVLALFN